MMIQEAFYNVTYGCNHSWNFNGWHTGNYSNILASHYRCQWPLICYFWWKKPKQLEILCHVIISKPLSTEAQSKNSHQIDTRFKASFTFMHIRCTENEQFLHQNKHQNKPFLWLCFHLRQSDKKGTPNNQRWNSPVRKAYHITFFRFNILQPGERWRERKKGVWERKIEKWNVVSFLEFPLCHSAKWDHFPNPVIAFCGFWYESRRHSEILKVLPACAVIPL